MTILKARRSFLAPDILTLGSPATAGTSFHLLKRLETKRQQQRIAAERNAVRALRLPFSSRLPLHDIEPGVL